MLDELKKKLFEMSKTETTPATSQAINLNAIQNTITSNNSNNTTNNNNISNTNNNPSTAAETLLANLATNNSSTQSTLSVVNEPEAKMPKLENYKFYLPLGMGVGGPFSFRFECFFLWVLNDRSMILNDFWPILGLFWEALG